MLRINPPAGALILSEYVGLKPGDWVVQNAAHSAVGRAVITIGKERITPITPFGVAFWGVGTRVRLPIACLDRRAQSLYAAPADVACECAEGCRDREPPLARGACFFFMRTDSCRFIQKGVKRATIAATTCSDPHRSVP
jgi:hypothetical protein